MRLTLDGLVQNPALLAMMERIDKEIPHPFGTEDFLIVDAVYRGHPVPEPLRERIPHLMELGVNERAAKGKYILSRRFYTESGKKGVYTRMRGLDRKTKKALLLKHLTENSSEGCPLMELCQVLPNLSSSQVQTLLREMKKEETVYTIGKTRAGKWFPTNPE